MTRMNQTRPKWMRPSRSRQRIGYMRTTLRLSPTWAPTGPTKPGSPKLDIGVLRSTLIGFKNGCVNDVFKSYASDASASMK